MVEPTDPFEYLQSFESLLDCHLTVGDPNSGAVEKIGVPRVMLLSHSSVFRDMLHDSELADPSGHGTHITDVEPVVFKLMLRHMFGCLDEPQYISKDLALPLAFCADKYNVKPLLNKACLALTPSGVDDIFPVLRCMTFISVSSSLEQSVEKIIREQTYDLIYHSEFLELDEKIVELVAKQDVLSVNEIVLWEALVRWAKYQQGKEKKEVTLRELLKRPLKFVRLMTLSPEQIVDHIMDRDILTTEEAVRLLRALIKKEILELPGLCTTTELRYKYQKSISVGGNTFVIKN